jgi:hypothetical protein
MSVSEMRAKINASIWQAVAQSGVDVSALPQKEVDKLVRVITEGVLQEVDNLLDEAAGTLPLSKEEGDDDSEQVLWEGRPFLSISVSYQITNERVRIIRGMFGKERRDIELVRVQDVDHKQNITERTLNIGDVYIRSSDVSDPEVVLNNVTNPQEVHEVLRKAVLKARKKHNMSFREEM